MSRLIAISNRIPTGHTPSGGLVVALKDALDSSDGIWIGAHPDPGPADETLEEIPGEGCTRLAFRLDETDIADYYLGYANSVLWPLCHRRIDLVDMPASYERRYREVNARVARMIAGIARPDDVIWVHDYHFFPLAGELRALGLSNRIGFFLHIPFPEPGSLSVLSRPGDFADWLASYNLIGLQTRADVARCREMFRADPRAEFMPDGTVKFRERVTSVMSFPIGIDVGDFRRQAEAEAPDPFGQARPESYVIGIDRLDYSKGIPNRFRAFGRYLESRPEGSRPCLVQIAPPTREQVQAYQDITSELEEIAGRLNGAHAELDWIPIRYIHRNIDRHVIARLLRGARACAVTSMADGMNLVAKEFVAAQDPEDPGVLILSRFAGAAEDMTEALLVNPHDIEDLAQAYHRALEMPLDERRRRHAACMEVVERTDAAAWAGRFLDVLNRCLPTLPMQRPGTRRAAVPRRGPDDRSAVAVVEQLERRNDKMTMTTCLAECRGFGALPNWAGLPPGNPPAEIPPDPEPDNSPPSPPTEAPEPDLPDVDPGGPEELPDREPEEAPDLPPELPPGRLPLSEPRPLGAVS